MASPPIARAKRVLMVTYDLTDTEPGDERYRRADQSLALHGEVFRPVKQIRLVITSSTSRRIKASLEQQIGRDTTILIAPLTSVPAWRVHGAAKRREWRRFADAVDAAGVRVRYLSRDTEGGVA